MHTIIFGNAFLVGLFSPINESIWEHQKLALVPLTFLGIILEIINFNDTKSSSNFWYNVFKSTIICMSFIVLGHYTFKFIFQKNSVIFDISLYIISMIISCTYIYKKTYTNESKQNKNAVGIICLCLTIILFMIFTIIPPNLPIFKDPITNTFGIYMIIY